MNRTTVLVVLSSLYLLPVLATEVRAADVPGAQGTADRREVASEASVRGQLEAEVGRAREYLNKGEYQAAADRLEKAASFARSNEQAVRIVNAAGWAKFSAGDLPAARELLARARSLLDAQADPAIARLIYNNSGIVEFTNGDFEAARDFLESEWASGSETSREYLARIEEREAAAAVRRHITAGIDHRLEGEFALAIEEYAKALELEPENARALEYSGYALFRLESNERALQMLEKAAANGSPGINTLINLMKVHCAMGDPDAALAVARAHPQTMRDHASVVVGDGELRRVCPDGLPTKATASTR